MWVCGKWMVNDLVKLGVNKSKIIVVNNMRLYDFGKFRLRPIYTYHDVENTSYLVDLKPITLYYATDTYKLDYHDCLHGINYYFVENNYSQEEIQKRIEEKELNGEYVYEKRVLNSHMSAEDVNSFLIEMMTDDSQFVYCHQHKDKSKYNFIEEGD